MEFQVKCPYVHSSLYINIHLYVNLEIFIALLGEKRKLLTIIYKNLSQDITSGSDITLCIKINKPFVVYMFSYIMK